MDKIRVPDVVAKLLMDEPLFVDERPTERIVEYSGDAIIVYTKRIESVETEWPGACAWNCWSEAVRAAAVVLAEALSANDHPLIEEALEQYHRVRDAAKILRAREEEYALAKADEQVGGDA